MQQSETVRAEDTISSTQYVVFISEHQVQTDLQFSEVHMETRERVKW
jgi:hypothetical protein